MGNFTDADGDALTVEGIYISEEIKAMKLHLPKKT
jgi:hypothetical protein